MNEINELIGQLDFARQRTLELLARIESDEHDTHKVLGWRPGPGRAHIGWQFMHLAATDDRYLHVRLLGRPESDPDLCRAFAGGSTPTDNDVPTPAAIRQAMEKHRPPLLAFFSGLDPSRLDAKPFPDAPRTPRDAGRLLVWHEGHHQGQAHISYNLYKAKAESASSN